MKQAGKAPVAFTTRRIAEIPAPATGQVEISDAQQPGLRLRVFSGGGRSWIWSKKVAGRFQRVTIGRYPEVDIDAARKAAARLSGEAAMGGNPAQARRQARVENMTFADAYDDYLRAKKLKPRTLEDYRSLFPKVSSIHTKRVDEITRDEIERLHRRITKESKSRADGAMRLVRAVLNRAIDRIEDAGGASFTNPVRRLSAQRLWNNVERKQTRVANEDLPAFVRAVREDASPVAGDLVLTLLGTGWRVGETRRLLWRDINLADGVVTLRAEETKAGRTAVLPIPQQVRAILAFRYAKKRPSASHVFEESRGRPLRSAKALLARVEAQTGIKAGHHDLRRTFASVGAREGLNKYTIKRLLNHAIDSSDVTDGYISLDLEELRSAQQRVADATLGVMPT